MTFFTKKKTEASGKDLDHGIQSFNFSLLGFAKSPDIREGLAPAVGLKTHLPVVMASQHHTPGTLLIHLGSRCHAIEGNIKQNLSKKELP